MARLPLQLQYSLALSWFIRIAFTSENMSEATVEQHLPFHQQLKRERELRNLSQEELAARVGTDPKTVSRWESGERLPRSDSREALCKLFGKNAEELGLLKAEERR